MRFVFVAVLLLSGCAASSDAQTARLSSQVEWNGRGAAFGGLSGLLIAPDGGSLLTVSDKGLLIEADLTRRADCRLTGVREIARIRLRDPDGVEQFDKQADAESLARRGDDLLIALEGRNTIWRLATNDALPVPLDVPPGITALQFNSGIEALASTPDGTLYAIPERSGALERPFPVFRLRGDVWDDLLQIPRDPPFMPTGADIGPDGRLYVLERDFTGIGFRAQVRSFAVGDALEDMRRVLAPVSTLDNAEGIGVWRDARGQLRMTIISDDNFIFLQRTLISEYILSGETAIAVD